MNKKNILLVVDIDGTLIKSDLLLESFYAAIRENPFLIFAIPLWLLQGKAHCKNRLAERANINVKTLPFYADFLEYLRSESKTGRTLILVTASARKYADAIAKHLGIFADVLATDEKTNLSGKTKLKVLLEKYGEKGFDYAGNDRSDLHIFPHAKQAILVNPGLGVLNMTRRTSYIEKIFSTNDVDKRDGFPQQFLTAQYVIVADPIQYHLNSYDQRIVGVPAELVLKGEGIGASFEKLPYEFNLDENVKAYIYKKIKPFTNLDLEALSKLFKDYYPDRQNIYEIKK